VGVELFRADRQTYVTNLIIAFSNFANAPNKNVFASQSYLVNTLKKTSGFIKAKML